MTRLKTKSTHGGIVGKANTKQGTSLGQKIYKVHDKNTLWRLTTTCLQHFGYPQRCSTSWAFTCRFQMTIFVPLRSNGLLHLPLGIHIFTAPLPWQSRRIISNTSRGMAHAAVTSGTSSYVFPKKIRVKRIEKFGRPLDRKSCYAHGTPTP